jgi:hypothetical protein
VPGSKGVVVKRLVFLPVNALGKSFIVSASLAMVIISEKWKSKFDEVKVITSGNPNRMTQGTFTRKLGVDWMKNLLAKQNPIPYWYGAA